MNKIYYLLTFLFVFLASCQKDADDVITPSSSTYSVKDFVWRGLNQWYLWQDEIPDLADDRFGTLFQTNANNKVYVEFLSQFQNPVVLFQHLRHNQDRFSWIVSDYTELEQQLQGIHLTTGMEIGAVRYNNGANVLGYVKYVLPNSDAEKKGIKRGDLFVTIDGEQLTPDNFGKLFYSNNSALAFGFASIDAQTKSINLRKEITLQQSQLQENPIHLYKILEVDNKKIGYLLYNSFLSDYDMKLNQIFAEFKANGITDLVLDLRYNSGGSVQSAIYLASMIGGRTGEIFVKQRSNKKKENLFKNYQGNFQDNIIRNNVSTPINKLNLSKLYVITSDRTASASELIINGLEPFVDVIQIGETTVGKNTASITIYDSPTGIRKNNINPSHKWAMQPIVLISENAKGFGAYQNGLMPDYPLEENVEELGVLGEESDPLLRRAIDVIVNRPFTSPMKISKFEYTPLDLKTNRILSNQMYITPEMILQK